MGTRSNIAIENKDGTIRSIYCHWDGYPSWNGRILLNNYPKIGKIRSLIALGDISHLDVEIGQKTNFNNPASGQVVAYGRDRNEKNVKARKWSNLNEYLASDLGWIEYVYVFRASDKSWYFSDTYDTISLRRLTPEDIKKNT